MYETLNIWISEPAYLPYWIFLVALLESLVLIGLFVPGVVILMGLAIAAGDQQVSIGAILLAGLLGAFAGDAFSYLFGRYASKSLLTRWPMKHHRAWVHRGQVFFFRYGGLSILAGRFIGPLRPVVPFAAGMMDMPAGRFTAWNLLSAVLWSPAYLLPGYYLGQQGWAVISQWSWLVPVAALACVFIYWLRRH